MTDLIRRSDDAWDSARAAWNLVIDQRPAAVVEATDSQGVVDAVRIARENGLRVAVQAEGHGAGALGDVGEDTLLLKTRGMIGVEVDVDARRARVAAGTKWRDVSEHASPAGLAALSGSSAEVGVVGYTLGGGLGWLGRKHGLACNSVVAADVVTAEGELVRADRDNEPDLFWALRGGGGAFGAVTSLELELYPVPEVYAGMLAWPWERSAEVLHAWRDWLPGLPDEFSTWARILQVPPLPDVPEPVRGRQLVVVEAAYLGDEAAATDLLQPLRGLGPEMDTFAVVPPMALGYLHMDPEDPVPFMGAGQLLDQLPSAAIDAVVEAAGPESGSPLLSIELRQLGGALSKAEPGAGALSKIDHAAVSFGVGMVMDEQMGAAVGGHVEKVVGALSPWEASSKFANFVDSPTESGMCYPPDTYERLQQVKAAYDPDDVFRSNHPIPCAAAAV